MAYSKLGDGTAGRSREVINRIDACFYRIGYEELYD